MIPAMGAMKTAYADMKLRKVLALERMIQGTIAHPPTNIAKMTPRRMLKYLGKREVISEDVCQQCRRDGMELDSLPLPKETELAEILTQI